MELQENFTRVTIGGHNTFWSLSFVTIEGIDFPALLCRWHTPRNTPVEYITKFSLEKVIGKGKAKTRVKRWKEGVEYISFDQPKGFHAEINTLLSNSMKSPNCPGCGTLLLVEKVKNVFFKELEYFASRDFGGAAKKQCIPKEEERRDCVWKKYEILFEGVEFSNLPEPEICYREGSFLICEWKERIFCSLLPWKTVYIENRLGGTYIYDNEYQEGMKKLESLLLLNNRGD